MKSAVGSLSACMTLFSLIVTSGQTVLRRNREGDQAIYPYTYLNSFGYLGQRRHAVAHTRADMRQAIKSYQEHTGLKVSGKMDRTTWELMTKPRCGVPDVMPPAGATRDTVGRVGRHKRRAGSEARSKINVTKTAKPKSSNKTVQDLTWHNKEVGYRTMRYFPHIPVDKQKSIFQEAFLRWSKPSKIHIQSKIDAPEIVITFARREHGDGDYNSFDGRGMQLAHAYAPGNASMSGDIHFDMDELWSTGVNKSDTRDLMMIAMHEAGHSLGLQHSKNKNDIMFPMYLDYNPDPQLSIADIKKLQQLYGRRPGFVASPRKRGVAKGKPVQKLPDKLLPKWCHQRFDSVVLGPGEVASIFTGSQVYRINNDGVMPGYPVHIGHAFPQAPTNPTAVFYVRDVRKTYFFKGTRIWRFTNTTLDVGYPKESKTPFLEAPRTALATTDSYGRSMVLFFGKKLTWRWNFDSEEVNGNYRTITTFWRGLPANIDAVVEWTDHYIYFFKGTKYYKASKHQKEVLSDYPRHVGPAWLGGVCGHAPK